MEGAVSALNKVSTVYKWWSSHLKFGGGLNPSCKEAACYEIMDDQVKEDELGRT
jgi:hypothetical protein